MLAMKNGHPFSLQDLHFFTNRVRGFDMTLRR